MRYSESLRVLCILPGIPLPANTGGTQRTLGLIEALDAQFELTVLAPRLADRDAARFRERLRGVLVETPPRSAPMEFISNVKSLAGGGPYGYPRYANPSLAKTAESVLGAKRFDIVHFDHLHTAQLLPLVRRLQRSARTVIDAHNVESLLLQRMASVSQLPVNLLLHWQGKRVRKLEEAMVSGVDMVLACSTHDLRALRFMGARDVCIVPNGVTLPEHAPATTEGEKKDIVFVGSFDWLPNADAATWLLRNVWPKISSHLRDVRLTLVGRNPPIALKTQASGRVVVTGTVPDVAPYLANAWVSAIPLRAGSGTRLKMLEAAAYGVPMIATRLAAEGLPVEDGTSIIYAETARDFVDALIRLRNDPGLANRIREAALKVAQKFKWKQIGESLAEHYRSWVRQDRSRAVPAKARTAAAHRPAPLQLGYNG